MFTLSTTILFVLLAIALVFAIIELGLSAYLISVNSTFNSSYYFDSSFYLISPSAVDLLLFDSLWTMLMTGFWLYVPYHLARKASLGPITPPILTCVNLALYSVTMVFWLAGFADLASWLGGFTPLGTIGATIAFGVLLWLLMIGLLVLTVLVALGVIESDVPGYISLKTKPNEENGAGQDADADPSKRVDNAGVELGVANDGREQYPAV